MAKLKIVELPGPLVDQMILGSQNVMFRGTSEQTVGDVLGNIRLRVQIAIDTASGPKLHEATLIGRVELKDDR